jgi:hypothetical protein
MTGGHQVSLVTALPCAVFCIMVGVRLHNIHFYFQVLKEGQMPKESLFTKRTIRPYGTAQQNLPLPAV